ncbi:MAG: nitrate/nitrite transporter NrtS [Alphaproteobacteria bacterium]
MNRETSFAAVHRPPTTALMFADGTPRKALLTAVIVGTLLTAINHGDYFLAGEMPAVWKIVLTYCVPYFVTTWGAVTGKLAQLKRQARLAASNAGVSST